MEGSHITIDIEINIEIDGNSLNLISLVAERLSASEGGLCFIELVSSKRTYRTMPNRLWTLGAPNLPSVTYCSCPQFMLR
jgi:hypothetical protein